MRKEGKLISTGIFTAIAASFCCITPLLALITGATGLASSFSWLEPFRPYLIGLSIIVLAFAWFHKLNNQDAQPVIVLLNKHQNNTFFKVNFFLV